MKATFNLLILLVPSISFAQDYDRLIKLQQRQIEIQEQILMNQQNQQIQGTWMDPSISSYKNKNQEREDLIEAIQEAEQRNKYLEQQELERKANEYYPEH